MYPVEDSVTSLLKKIEDEVKDWDRERRKQTIQNIICLLKNIIVLSCSFVLLINLSGQTGILEEFSLVQLPDNLYKVV